MEKVDKEQLRQRQAIYTVFNSVFSTNISLDGKLTQNLIDEMMLDIDIKSCIDSIKAAVVRKKIRVVTEEGIDEEKTKQYNDLDTDTLIRKIIDSKFTAYQVLELLYDDKYKVEKFVVKPREFFRTEYKQDINDFVWTYSYKGLSQGQELPFGKFLIPVNEATEQFSMGRSELEPLVKWYKIKNNSLTFANEIIAKYGGVITWFVYNEGTSETELQEMVDGLANVADGSILPIPSKPGNPQQGLNKEFGFIKTSDLTSDVHKNMIDFCKNQISEYLLGNSLVQRNTGSYAAANAANDIRTEITDSYERYVANWLNWLLYYDGVISGYNYKDYTFELYDEDNVTAIEQTKTLKLDNYLKLNQIGYTLTKEYISEQLGIPIEALTDKPASTPFEFSEKVFKKKINVRKRIKKNFKEIDAKTPEVTEKITYSIKKLIENSNNINDIQYDFIDDMRDILTIAQLKGRLDVFEENNSKLEFNELVKFDSVFDMPFSEAVNFFIERYPRFLDLLDKLAEELDANYSEARQATKHHISQSLQKSLTKAINEGLTYEQWQSNAAETLQDLGIAENGWYTKVIFRTNLSTAYNTGRLEQQKENIENAPYWLYDAIDDDRTSEICQKLNGKIYRADDPIWNEIYPPCHFNCRSGVISLDKEEYKEAIESGETFIRTPEKNADTNEALELLRDTSFDKPPGV
jgi:SPP1 gp7 family putative phage head morphogenesis protein